MDRDFLSTHASRQQVSDSVMKPEVVGNAGR